MIPIDFEVTWSKLKVKLLVVVKIMFDQYLSPSLLEICQTWCGCPLRVDDPY